MAFDVVMFGVLEVPSHAVEDWLSTPVEQTEFPWLEELGGVDVQPDTPEALLTLLRELPLAPHEFLDATLSDGRLELACYVGEDTFREVSQALALLAASTAEFGAVGQVTFAGYRGIRFGERVVVLGGRAHFRVLAPEVIRELEELPSFEALDRRIHERFESLVGAEPQDSIRRGAVNPFTGRTVAPF